MTMFEKDNKMRHFFAREIAKKITGEFKQNAVIICTGSMGSGKSWSMIRLANLIAHYVSLILKDKPENHFVMNGDHVGIMIWDNIEKVFEKMDFTQNGIFIIDDAGATVNSRKFSSNANIAINDRIQTMRPNKNVVIITTPHGMLVDKVIRSLSTYHIKMAEPYFKLGYTTANIYKLSLDDDGRIYRAHLQTLNGEKIYLHMFTSPLKVDTDLYDKLREEASKKLNEQSRKSIEAHIQKISEDKPKPKKNVILDIYQAQKSGKHGNISFKELCKINGFDYGYAMQLVNKFKNSKENEVIDKKEEEDKFEM